MGYTIRIMYGDKVPATVRFMFDSDNRQDINERFDKAVKELNSIYNSSGRFKTYQEVISHFEKYDFYRVAM